MAETKRVTVFSATGTVGQACVNEMLEHTNFTVRVLKRKPGQLDKSTTNAINSDAKEQIFKDWSDRGVEIIEVDATYHAELIPALQGTDYLISCVPYFGTESQYPLIWAAAEAGVERFIPSEFGFIYEFEQFWETPHAHRDMARQKAFIRRVIQLAGLDYTIIPAGLFPEYFMAEPVLIPNGGDAKMAWTTATDAGRIIPHVLSHRLSRNAICPVAGTAWMSWNEFLAIREQHLGRKIEREYMNTQQLREAFDAAPPGFYRDVLLAIAITEAECPEGMPLWAYWNATYLPEFKGMPLDKLFTNIIEPTAKDLGNMFKTKQH